jgi:hypothetical protein
VTVAEQQTSAGSSRNTIAMLAESAPGSQGGIEAEPCEVLFSALAGRSESKVIMVRNRDPVSRRIHILCGTCPHFKLSVPKKKGDLAPGMSQQIVVTFTCPPEEEAGDTQDVITITSEV